MKIGFEFIGISTPFYCHDGKGNILLHKRSKRCRDEVGTWDPGSGQLEFGLSIEKNVLKEVKEEYGCVGTIQHQLPPHDIFRTQNNLPTHWIAIPHIILVDRKKVKNNEPKKIEEIGWFKLSSLPHPIHSGFQYTLSKFKKEIQTHID